MIACQIFLDLMLRPTATGMPFFSKWATDHFGRINEYNERTEPNAPFLELPVSD
jgi:hypothetical protein